MNIFFLDLDQTVCAQYHVDTHVRKMIVESAQLLATAHRLLNGKETKHRMENGKIRTFFLFEGEKVVNTIIKDKQKAIIVFPVCYNATHINHPSAKWVRQSKANYMWLLELLKALLVEYEYRFDKEHKTKETLNFLGQAPINLPDYGLTTPSLAMDEQYISIPIEMFSPHPFLDATLNYQNYYRLGKKHLHNWTKRPVPHFI